MEKALQPLQDNPHPPLLSWPSRVIEPNGKLGLN